MAKKQAASKAASKTPLQKELSKARAVARQQGWSPARTQKKLDRIRAKHETQKESAYSQRLTQELSANHQVALAIINSDPELRQLFETAVKNGTTVDVLFSQIQGSNWYRTHGEAYRKAAYLEVSSPADWQSQLDLRKREISRQASKVGATVSEQQLADLARQSLYGGWEPEFIQTYLADYIDTGSLGIGTDSKELYSQLRSFAADNGVQMSDEFFQAAVRAGIKDPGSVDTYVQEIKTRAAGLYPVWADKLSDPNSEITVKALAGSYIETMKNMLDLTDADVSLTDPVLSKALKATTESGEPAIMPLWQFEREIRKTDKWVTSKAGQSTVEQAMNGLLGKMGF